MIRATISYTACFAARDGYEAVTQPVIAWDEQGWALIADHDTGRLVRAAQEPRFAGLFENPDHRKDSTPWPT
ncbi:hypothetical protein [Streptomyces chartreusis]|uniref:hypothetical protein n=1 Tax=Streptomyces chartreusis TaxID=1969 RepID=UPI0033C37B6C